MDFIPVNVPNMSTRLIAMAVALVGSPQSVMLEMKCSNEEFGDYCSGRKPLTQTELERLLQLIIAEQTKLIAKTKELLAETGEGKTLADNSPPGPIAPLEARAGLA